MQTIKDWHLLSVLGVILGIEAAAYILLQTIAFTVTKEFGEELNRENPVRINVTNNYKPIVMRIHKFLTFCWYNVGPRYHLITLIFVITIHAKTPSMSYMQSQLFFVWDAGFQCTLAQCINCMGHKYVDVFGKSICMLKVIHWDFVCFYMLFWGYSNVTMFFTDAGNGYQSGALHHHLWEPTPGLRHSSI